MLADITGERQLPLSYLGALITLFLFMVGERVFYSQVGPEGSCDPDLAVRPAKGQGGLTRKSMAWVTFRQTDANKLQGYKCQV